MEPKEELNQYEQNLVRALWDQTERRRTETPGSLQIIVDTQSVGVLECEPQAKAEKVFQAPPCPGLIEVRSSSGLPVGILSPEPLERTTTQFQAGNYLIELEVQPQQDKSLVHLRSRNLMATSHEAHGIHHLNPDEPKVLKSDPSPWSMVALAAQLILAAGVVFLVADRFFELTNQSSDKGQLVATRDQQLEQVLLKLTALQKRLEQPSMVAVKNSMDSGEGNSAVDVVSHESEGQSKDTPLLQKKAQVFEEGILKSRPVWVRFKKDIEETRRKKFFKEVSAKDHAQMGGWYSFNLNLPNSQSPDEILKPLSERGDIEIITTSVVTRRVKVRFKKDVADNDINGFFEEVRVERQKPKDNWYNLDLSLPEPVQPESFISELRSGSIVEKVNVNLDALPAM